MGGGGFMQDANNVMKRNSSQKTSGKPKFNGTYQEKPDYSEENATKLDFTHVTKEEIEKENLKIIKRIRSRKKNHIIIFIVATVIAFFLLFFLF